MNEWFKAKEYLHYLLNAKSVHSIHSPFVFDFIQNVLHDRRTFYCYDEIEALRITLLESDEEIVVNDLGAGSHISTSPGKKISEIAKHSSTPPKFSKLLFRIGNYFESKKILELGTSLGLTSLYLSSISKDATVVTLEGDFQLSLYAQKNFETLTRKNVTRIEGPFDEKLPDALKQLLTIDFAYIDGNHRKEATLSYFNTILPFTHDKTILVIGDIHWSREMKEAWTEIISQLKPTLTIDLFYLGIIFFRKELSKQNFVLRF